FGSRQCSCSSRSCGFDRPNLDAVGTHPLQGCSDQLATAAATRSWIDHGQKAVAHNSITVLSGSRLLPISSAKIARLIFMDAVRGKSLSQIKYPPTRWKSGNCRLRALISLLSDSENS